MFDPQMMDRIETGWGFITALDQSGGSTPKALKVYGIDQDAYSGEDEMFTLIHKMRTRIMTAPSFASDKIIGTILFEKTMDGAVDRKPVPSLLWERNIVPFLKVDAGLEHEANGVQMMLPILALDALLERAKKRKMFGTKTRSVIHLASPTGIAAIVSQQFEAARNILDHGLLPIIEPEVSIKSVERNTCEALLLQAIEKQLEALPEGYKVMLKLSLPARANLYAPLLDHPRVARIAALSGGFSRDKACKLLAENRGMIASFSRALLQDLRLTMTDGEFDHALGEAIDQIYLASTQKSHTGYQ